MSYSEGLCPEAFWNLIFREELAHRHEGLFLASVSVHSQEALELLRAKIENT